MHYLLRLGFFYHLGHCFAGGAFVAICHDYRVMRSDRGWISWNETLIHLRISDPLIEILQQVQICLNSSLSEITIPP